MPSPITPPELPTKPADLDMTPRLLPAARRVGSLLRRWAGVFDWRRAPAAAQIDPLAARAAFVACLADLPAPDTRALCHLLGHAGSLAELWHLRPEVYRVLALHHSQAEAERRLALIARQFDRRTAPRHPAAARPV